MLDDETIQELVRAAMRANLADAPISDEAKKWVVDLLVGGTKQMLDTISRFTEPTPREFNNNVLARLDPIFLRLPQLLEESNEDFGQTDERIVELIAMGASLDAVIKQSQDITNMIRELVMLILRDRVSREFPNEPGISEAVEELLRSLKQE